MFNHRCIRLVSNLIATDPNLTNLTFWAKRVRRIVQRCHFSFV